MKQIPMPDEVEKQRAIKGILEKAQRLPKSPHLPNLCRQWTGTGAAQRLGVRYLVAGQKEILFLSAIAAAIGLGLFLPLLHRYLYSAVFLLSPGLYLLVFYLSYWKEWSSSTWQIIATCKITLRQLTAMRMVLFGGISLLVNTALLPLLTLVEGNVSGPLELLGLSYCSVFLFALLVLAFLPGRRQVIVGAPIFLWSLLAVLAVTVEAINLFLQNLPYLAVLGILAVLLLLFGVRVKQYYHGRGGSSYAFGE